MKGGFYGLKVTQVSFILIGFVCVAVLGLAWTNTSILTSLKPPQNNVLRIAPGVYSQPDISLNYYYVFFDCMN